MRRGEQDFIGREIEKIARRLGDGAAQRRATGVVRDARFDHHDQPFGARPRIERGESRDAALAHAGQRAHRRFQLLRIDVCARRV